MRTAILTMVLLLVICFSVVCWLEPRREARASANQPTSSDLGDLLGDGREMVADYFKTEADVYFHSGYYPSIFDQARQQEEADSDVMHPEEPGGSNGGQGAQEEKGFMGPPLDWIDRFGRNFLPSRHTHLPGEEIREILPWLKLSAELNPHNIQTYMVTDYWLRKRLRQSQEAEDFLRDGLRSNPHSPDLLFALGQIYLEDRKDYPRARNLFVAALRCWHERDDSRPVKSDTGPTKDYFLWEEILGGLIQDDLATGNLNQALADMKELKANASDPEGVQKQIDILQARINAGKTGAPAK